MSGSFLTTRFDARRGYQEACPLPDDTRMLSGAQHLATAQTQVAATLDGPFLGLLHLDRTDQSADRSLVREDPDEVDARMPKLRKI